MILKIPMERYLQYRVRPHFVYTGSATKNFVVQSVGSVIKKSTWISNERTHRITFVVQKYNNRYNYRNTNTYII